MTQYYASQPNWRIPVKDLDNVDNPEAKSGVYIKGGWPDKREVTEHPPTRERERARHYLTNLNVIRKDIIDKSDLLRFYAKVQTSHSKTCSAYTLMDPGASHCYIDTAFSSSVHPFDMLDACQLSQPEPNIPLKIGTKFG